MSTTRRSGSSRGAYSVPALADRQVRRFRREPVATVAIFLTATTVSFQLLETMGYLPGVGLRNEAAHLTRLSASAAYFDFQLDEQDVQAELRGSVAGAFVPRRVRLTVRADGEAAVETRPMPPADTGPVSLTVDHEQVFSHTVWLRHKTTRREAYDVRAARHSSDDVVLVNEHGQLTDSTIANLAVRLDGIWFTPPLESGCLPGVERGRLVRERLLRERTLTVTDLYASEGVALVSSLRGWRVASLVSPSGSPLPRPPATGTR